MRTGCSHPRFYAQKKDIDREPKKWYAKNVYGRPEAIFRILEVAEEKAIGIRSCKLVAGGGKRSAFTLIELLMVISVIALLMGILVPAFGKVKRHVRSFVGMSNQRQIVTAVICYELDNDGRYPDSVATIGTGDHWHWQEPTMLTAYRRRSPNVNRSMSAYLRDYIKDVELLFSPDAPKEYKYLDEMWQAGDDWDNPDTPATEDPVIGTYCFYWNYKGFLSDDETIFNGPRGSSSGRRRSKLLVTDYFGYDHWRSPKAYSSSVRFGHAVVTPGTPISSAFWSYPPLEDQGAAGPVSIKLRAGYTDGHVEYYSGADVVPMKVPITADGSVPYPDGVGPGEFFLPINALH